MNEICPTTAFVPSPIEQMGEQGKLRFLEFFTANIRNKNTRQAYARAAGAFLTWCEQRGLRLETIDPVMTAAYIDGLQSSHAEETVKQHLAAIRALFDYLVTGVSENVPENSHFHFDFLKIHILLFPLSFLCLF